MCLSQLIMLNGLQSNPDIPGTEKVVVTDIDPKWLSTKANFISASELEVDAKSAIGKLVSPGQIFCVKGWNRSVCGLLVLLAIWEMPNLVEAWLSDSTHFILEFAAVSAQAVPQSVLQPESQMLRSVCNNLPNFGRQGLLQWFTAPKSWVT